MSSYVRWYKKEQDNFKAELNALSFKQIVSTQADIRARAIRLGMVNYCEEHGFLSDDYTKETIPDFTESVDTTAETEKLSWFSRIGAWFKKEVFKHA